MGNTRFRTQSPVPWRAVNLVGKVTAHHSSFLEKGAEEEPRSQARASSPDFIQSAFLT